MGSRCWGPANGLLGLPLDLYLDRLDGECLQFHGCIDGLAGSSKHDRGTRWMALGYMLAHAGVISLSGVIAGFEPGLPAAQLATAKIFMGDVGSPYLGYTFAALPLLARHMATRGVGSAADRSCLICVVLSFPIRLYRLRRLLRGDNVFAAHREHIFSGWSLRG